MVAAVDVKGPTIREIKNATQTMITMLGRAFNDAKTAENSSSSPRLMSTLLEVYAKKSSAPMSL